MTHPVEASCWTWEDTSTSFRCTVVANLCFWTASFLGFCVDQVARKNNKLVLQWKLQPDQHLSAKEQFDLFRLAFFNMVFMGFFVCCPLYEWLWSNLYSNRLVESDDWNWQQEVFLKLPIHMIITETGFYGVHYLLHYFPFLYQHVHKVHHRFKAPTAMTAVYAHPLEFALGNVLEIYLGPMMTNAHPYTSYAWFAMAMWGTCVGHSGYRIPILNHADPHEEHHLLLKCNYGGIPYLSDVLFGTFYQRPYRKDNAKKKL